MQQWPDVHASHNHMYDAAQSMVDAVLLAFRVAIQALQRSKTDLQVRSCSGDGRQRSAVRAACEGVLCIATLTHRQCVLALPAEAPRHRMMPGIAILHATFADDKEVRVGGSLLQSGLHTRQSG